MTLAEYWNGSNWKVRVRNCSSLIESPSSATVAGCFYFNWPSHSLYDSDVQGCSDLREMMPSWETKQIGLLGGAYGVVQMSTSTLNVGIISLLIRL